MQKKPIDQRITRRIHQKRTILKLRLKLLEKDIGADGYNEALSVIDTFNEAQLDKLRNITVNITEEILATYKNAIAIKK